MKKQTFILILICILCVGSTIHAQNKVVRPKSKTETTKKNNKNNAIGKFYVEGTTYTLLSNGKINSSNREITGKYNKLAGTKNYRVELYSKPQYGDWYVVYLIVGNNVYAIGGGTDGTGIDKFSYNPSDKTLNIKNESGLDNYEFMQENGISSLRPSLYEFEKIGTVTWLK